MTDVRSIRQEMGLSQGRLAEMLGVNQSTISRFETGELPVDGRTSLALDALRRREVARPAVALCTRCDVRAEDPHVASCTAAECPMRDREAA